MKQNRLTKLYKTILFFLCIGFVIGTRYDFEIASKLFMKDNLFSYIFEVITPLLVTSLMTFASALLYLVQVHKRQSIVHYYVTLFVFVVSIVIAFVVNYGYLQLIGVLYTIIVSLLMIWWVFHLVQDESLMYSRIAIAILLIMILSMVSVDVIKIVWGRVRFRAMQDNLDVYTNWYIINGNRFASLIPSLEERKSFPSGHSMWSAVLLSISMLPLAHPRWYRYEYRVVIGSLVLAIIIMVSRMLQGAHFLSDVCFGFSIGLIIYVMVRRGIVVEVCSE